MKPRALSRPFFPYGTASFSAGRIRRCRKSPTFLKKIKMKRKSLNALGIWVSGDITVGELFRMTREELLTQNTADKISALRELCEEFCEYRSGVAASIDNARDAARLMSPQLKCLDHEECWVLLMDRACHPVRKVRITSGGTAACLIDIPKIVKSAIIAGATGVILFHNHPSGNTRPSKSDLEQTRNLRDILNQLGLTLNDHIIIGDGRYFSFTDEAESEL